VEREVIFYLPAEVVSRELDSRLMIASVLVGKGHTVFFGQPNVIERSALKFPGVFLHKMHSLGDKSLVKRLSESGNIVAAIDEEALHQSDVGSWIQRQTHSETVRLLSRIFANSEEQYLALRGAYSDDSSRVVLTGNPRLEMLKPEFRGLRSVSAKKARFPAPYLLIITNFASANLAKSYGMSASSHLAMTVNVDRHVVLSPAESLEKQRWIENQIQFEMAQLEIYKDVVKRLAEKFPNISLVLRPHPVEEIRTWRTALKGFANVRVDRTGPASNWIENAVCIVHPGSTTSLEAFHLGKKAFHFSPVPFRGIFEVNRIEAPAYFGEKVEDLDTLIAAISQQLRAPGIARKHPTEIPAISESFSHVEIAEQLVVLAGAAPYFRQLFTAKLHFFWVANLVEIFAVIQVFKSLFVSLFQAARSDLGSNYLKFPWISFRTVSLRLWELANRSRDDSCNFGRNWRLLQWGPRAFTLEGHGGRHFDFARQA